MASMNEKDYYEILGVAPDATTEEIRKAFQKKARTLHPDINKAPDAEERFKEVSEAYAVLSDSQKRSRYDAMRAGGAYGVGGWQPTGGYAGQGGSGAGYGSSGGWPFGGMWTEPFTGRGSSRQTGRRSYKPEVGANVVVQLDLDDKSAREGVRRGITYNRYVRCDNCDGLGSLHANEPETCPTCSGSGRISVDLASLLGFGVVEMVCPECEGSGKVVVDPCHMCSGSGRVLSASEISVEIPPNSHDGDEVVIKGQGNAGTNGSAAGDFVCRVGVPSERLDPIQGFGLQIVGFCLPFLVLGAIAGVLSAMVGVVVVPLVFGLVLTVSRGVFGRRGTWWKNAGKHVLSGATNGLIIAVFMVTMVSCVASTGRAGFFY